MTKDAISPHRMRMDQKKKSRQGQALAPIRIRDLTKIYGGRVVVDSVSLEVRPGEIYGLLGPNGAGKTTTIRMILGLLKPSRGQAELFGTNAYEHGDVVRRRLGVVGEQTYLYDDMTAVEYLEFFAHLFSMDQARRRAMELLERLGLAPFANLVARDFSQGMQKKLSIARALIHEPETLVLDEPISGLDPNSIVQVRELLVEKRKKGTAILVSSHILSEVERTADRVGILMHGQLKMEDTVKHLGERLLPSHILEIELHSPVAKIKPLLLKLPGVLEVHCSGSLVRLKLKEGRDLRSPVSKAIIKAGGTIVGMKTRKNTLEDAFVRLTEGKG